MVHVGDGLFASLTVEVPGGRRRLNSHVLAPVDAPPRGSVTCFGFVD
jgi:hypothetical protein